MVNIVSCYMSMLHKMVKLAGMQSKEIEIEADTLIHFWVPSKSSKKPKPALVLIHGFAGDGILTWQFQVLSSLRKKYSLYVPDLLFFGRSHTSRGDRSPRFQADCLAAGLRKLGLEKCIVVGFSYGGFVGFQMAEHHPDLVESMVVIGSNLALTQSITSRAFERLGVSSWPQLLLPTSPQGVKFMLEAASFKLPWLPSFFYKHYLQAMFGNRQEKMELLEALVVRDEDVTTYQFPQRIHLLWGNEDQVLNMEVANNLKEILGGKTKLLTVKKAGHLVILERPCAINKCLKQLAAEQLAAEQHTHTT